jgi:catechol 2,3-dioxygenase-like lactoylglutathione lyase family enzyme
MPKLPPHYHVGIVVADLAAARSRFADLLGITWGPVLDLPTVEYRDGDGNDVVLPTLICYSTGDPSIELIQERPGSIWVCNEHSSLHHVGFWSDDMRGESTKLSEAGCPLQLAGRAGSAAPVQFAYHRDTELGVRIELVDSAMREAMAFLFTPDQGEV